MSSPGGPASEQPPSGADPLAVLVERARSAAPHELADLVDACARALGAQGAVAYLADLQQRVLVPLVPVSGFGNEQDWPSLSIDATLAGRAFQTYEVQLQDIGVQVTRVWLPLVAGADRVGVLAVALAAPSAGGLATAELGRLAAATAELVATKTLYGDTLVRLRRTVQMALAAEMQWSLLPPLTFAGRQVAVTAALEPAYLVAGDTIDYAVDTGLTHAAIFDVMGHGLHSAQCAGLCVAAYRNARRAGATLTDTLRRVDEALLAGIGGETFATAVLAQLHTETGLVEWVNAGHPEPLLLRDGKLIKYLHVEPHPPAGLGLPTSTTPVAVGQEQLEPGDQILLYTDGVVEARAPSGEFFGTERLADLVIRHLAGGFPPPETMRRVVRELLEHHKDRLSDDASLLLLEWRGHGPPPR